MTLQSQLGKRGMLFLLALGFLSFTLVACSVGPSAQDQTTQQYPFSTPNPLLNTPTPTFPPFTVGAWPSNYSPNNADTITIYVVCRAQVAAMNGPSTPVKGLTVNVTAGGPGQPVNVNGSGTTDADGMAAIPVAFTDPKSGVPIVVQVTVTYQHTTYNAQTFFTPNPSAKPTPKPKATGTAGATPTATTGQ